MYFVSPRAGEKYYLRLLLSHVPGATSFADMKRICDPPAATYREAAITLGLLDDDQEWDRCIQEAATYGMPRQLRHLFATILMFNQPQEPLALWEKHSGHLIEDFEHRLRMGGFPTDDAGCKNAALWEINEILRGGGTWL
jgi:hypothetical protein